VSANKSYLVEPSKLKSVSLVVNLNANKQITYYFRSIYEE